MKVVHGLWLLATGEDARLAEGEGATTNRFDRLSQRSIDEFIGMCASNRGAAEVFMGVNMLVKPATALFAPSLAFKVRRRMIRREKPQGRPTDPIPTLMK